MTPHPPQLPRTCHHHTGPSLEPISSQCAASSGPQYPIFPHPQLIPIPMPLLIFFLARTSLSFTIPNPLLKSIFACHLCYQKQCRRAPGCFWILTLLLWHCPCALAQTRLPSPLREVGSVPTCFLFLQHHSQGVVMASLNKEPSKNNRIEPLSGSIWQVQ